MSKEETKHTQKGTVTFFSMKKGFGFITPEGEKEKENDVFVHRTGLATNENDEPIKITAGDKVIFLIQEVEENNNGPVATNVRKVDEE